MMREYINKLFIKSYRGIKDLELNDLCIINILTGDNNCGKTSILEVLESYDNPQNFRTWSEVSRKGNSRVYGMTLYEAFLDLFDIDQNDKFIEYQVTSGDKVEKVVVKGSIASEMMTESQYLNEVQNRKSSEPYDENDDNAAETLHEILKLQLEVLVNNIYKESCSIYDGQRLLSPFKFRLEHSKNIIYISPTRHADSELFLSDILDHSELYEQMLNVLKEFDENIISINYDSKNNSMMGRGIYKILSKDHEKALPLNVYGDGMKKAILLMSAVVRAENGILLLDEFETAIHTSAMDKIFSWILNTCKELNVQLFLTSHSEEAISKVLKCCPEMQEDIALYTLYKRGVKTMSRRLMAKEAIEASESMGMELR